MDRKPFTTVYLTGTARDTQHRRMSKSLGNGIDPLDVVQLYGADALRWTLVAGSSLAADVILDPNDLEATFAPGRNFANKLWNIGRFILSQLPAEVTPRDQIDRAALTLADRWILSRAEATIRDATADLEQFRLDEAAKTCFAFAWGELADWYVEAVKPRLTADDASARIAQAVLTHCFDTVLRLLHPVVPFITEELWQKLPGGERAGDELLIVARWPEPRPAWTDVAAEAAFTAVQQAITAIRNIRAEYRIPPKTRVAATIAPRTADGRHTFEAERDTILRLAQLGELTLNGAAAGEGGAHAVLADGSEVAVALAGAIDVQQECRRLSDELGRLDRQLAGLAVKLANGNFVSRAPADVVAREREKEQTWRAQRDVLAGKLSALGCS
jgi:valyl-tRNA synthetase